MSEQMIFRTSQAPTSHPEMPLWPAVALILDFAQFDQLR